MDHLAEMIPVALFIAIPIVAILTRHQQKMAQILHDRPRTDDQERVLQEMASLRQLVSQQSITLDDLGERQRELARRLDSDPELRDRLRS